MEGRRIRLPLLYPLVKEYFEEMRLHGKYVDALDLEDYFVSVGEKWVMRWRSAAGLRTPGLRISRQRCGR